VIPSSWCQFTHIPTPEALWASASVLRFGGLSPGAVTCPVAEAAYSIALPVTAVKVHWREWRWHISSHLLLIDMLFSVNYTSITTRRGWFGGELIPLKLQGPQVYLYLGTASEGIPSPTIRGICNNYIGHTFLHLSHPSDSYHQ
jgi:hypothetical protein